MKTLSRWFRSIQIVWLLAAGPALAAPPAASRPNIVLIVADGMGFGDPHALNPKHGMIATPNIDRVAAAGMTFIDAHAPASVSTPSRYGILTGRYAWRTRLQRGVLFGTDPPLIAPSRTTLATFLKSQGYKTACIGKWHLGMDWPGAMPTEETNRAIRVDPDKPIRNGPLGCGFDAFFGIAASPDMPPFYFIENDRCVKSQDDAAAPRVSPPGFAAGELVPRMTRRATEYIAAHPKQAVSTAPFFLYIALTSPNPPIMPSGGFRGKSGLNDYADAVMETDWAVGEIVGALDAANLSGDTLLFVTSDTGCSSAAEVGIPVLAQNGHLPGGGYRGFESDIWEGGHRVPLFARWPGTISPGSRSDSLVCLTDFLATFAEILGHSLAPSAGEDSVSFLSVLKGSNGTRTSVVHHSGAGCFAVREGKWKLCLGPDSGGNSEPRPGSAAAKSLPPTQLYDLTADPGETRNMGAERPDEIARLTRKLERIVEEGRSTPGPGQKNDREEILRQPLPKGR